MRRTPIVVLTIVTLCNVKVQKQLLTTAISGNNRICIALDETKKINTVRAQVAETLYSETLTDPQIKKKKEVNLNYIKPSIYHYNMRIDAS